MPSCRAISVAFEPIWASSNAERGVRSECTGSNAAERTRTSTPVRARRPERRVYTNFTTAAGRIKLAGRG